MTSPSSGARKLTLDEPSFQNLLAAAYALQENKDVLQAGSSEDGSASIFSQIAALRSQILAHSDSAELKAVNAQETQVKRMSAAEAAALVADSLKRLTKADGANVCLIIDGYLRPTACSGRAAKVSGGSVASNSLVATERLRNGRAFQSANACSDIRLGPSLCVELQIGSLLAFPIERQNEIAGLIEVRWTKDNAFSDGDERICQLMADLMREVLEGELGRVKAQGTRPAQITAFSGPTAEQATPVSIFATQDQESAVADTQVTPADRSCRVCGKPLNDDLNFCGSCGMLSSTLDNGMQGKWASMWFMQQARKAVQTVEGQGERLWPLHVENSHSADASGTTCSTNEPCANVETGETSPQSKRSARGVLAILKSRLRARAMGQ